MDVILYRLVCGEKKNCQKFLDKNNLLHNENKEEQEEKNIQSDKNEI